MARAKHTAKSLKHNNTIPCGLHMVMVDDICFSKDSEGNILHQEGVIHSIDVTFIEMEATKRKFTSQFFLSDNARWLITALCDAVEVSNKNNSVKKSEIVGKRLWIAIANCYYIHEGKRSEIVATKLVPKFWPIVMGGIRSAISGDPALGGEPSNIFAIEKEVEYDKWIQYAPGLQMKVYL